MSAPDLRYLVPETSLPFFPVGGPNVWVDDEGKPTKYPGLRSVAHLDLSRPAERDGLPVSMDALPWALVVLAKRIGHRIDTIDELRPMIWGGSTTWAFDVFGVGYVAVLRPEDDGWEDYNHTDANQPRRIVAAALRKTHVQKVSP